MIEFMSGAVTVGYLVAAGFFLRYWRKSGDRLFAAFSGAFLLFALNQLLAAAFINATDLHALTRDMDEPRRLERYPGAVGEIRNAALRLLRGDQKALPIFKRLVLEGLPREFVVALAEVVAADWDGHIE